MPSELAKILAQEKVPWGDTIRSRIQPQYSDHPASMIDSMIETPDAWASRGIDRWFDEDPDSMTPDQRRIYESDVEHAKDTLMNEVKKMIRTHPLAVILSNPVGVAKALPDAFSRVNDAQGFGEYLKNRYKDYSNRKRDPLQGPIDHFSGRI